MIRDDLSDRLIHLTRHGPTLSAAENFVEIFGDGKLVGGSGHIRGGFRCVCFSEAPIAKLSQILAWPDPDMAGMPYAPFGVIVTKKWLFRQGGRPVIYQPEAEYELLHDSQKYRHVRLEEPGNDRDVTWEREWRVLTDELTLDPVEATLVVPTRAWEDWFKHKHAASASARARAFGGWMPRNSFVSPWHFIVLEDLGVPIPDVEPPPERA